MKKGFTLIELLVVVLIIGILSSIALPNYKRSVERTRVAEVQTLLRAIHESQERLLWQKGFSSYAEAVAKAPFGFDKLDITIKGTYARSPSTGIATGVLKTENFSYEMLRNGVVVATAIKGDYIGAEIGFTLGQFMCNKSTAIGVKACKVWGADTWNQL